MHKKIRLLVCMLAAAAMLVLLPDENALTAKAETNTYSLKYFGGDINDWRYVPGNKFEDGMYHKELYRLKTEELKDGDLIIVYPGDEVPSNKELDLSGFKLGNLTVYQNASAIIFADSIKDCYILAGAYTAINGDVTNAHLYDNTTCTFNNNVLDMVLHINDKPYSNISCAGTVGKFLILNNEDQSKGVFYDIPKNTMMLSNGTIQFPNWSAEPSDAYLQARAAADGTAEVSAPSDAPAASAPATAAAGTSSDEYDQVPKTGESNNIIWLVSLTGAAAILFAGSYMLYRKTK